LDLNDELTVARGRLAVTKEVREMPDFAGSLRLSGQTPWRFGLALRSSFAAHGGGSSTVHACVGIYDGKTRIMLPGKPPTALLARCSSSGRATPAA
jgi:hypothetical protein